MSQYLIFLLICATVLIALPELSDGKKCGPNESYSQCGEVCKLTCKNYNNPRACLNMSCNGGGCRCNQHYVRNDEGKCVLVSECKK